MLSARTALLSQFAKLRQAILDSDRPRKPVSSTSSRFMMPSAAAPASKVTYEGYRGHGVLTYAFLEALNKVEGAPEETVFVFDRQIR
jgi:hypothetical protein